MHKPKKSLGQNFLKSQKALVEIISAGNVGSGNVLEIGPGKGVLTEKLIQAGAHVVAVEKDSELVLYLQEKFTEEIKNKKVNLIEGDILEFEPEKMGRYKIIANIPYNITGAIIRKFLENKFQPTTMVLLVQKEVAERIAKKSKNTKESLLSLSVKAYGTPKYISTVSKRYFSPAPKVDSAIITIQNISRANFKNTKHEENFFQLIKNAFAHKRKQLYGNLKEGGYSADWIEKQFTLNNISKTVRAEDIGIEKWLALSLSI